jgi:hypothetical protein
MAHPDELMTEIHDTCPRTDPGVIVPPDCAATPPASFYVTSANPR